MTKTIIKNATLILQDDVVFGGMALEDGLIVEIFSGTTQQDGHDFEGDFLTPGLIELHTDNIEGHLQPRPKAFWPVDEAIIAHDAELASVGITTVFDALRVGMIMDDLSTTPSSQAAYARNAATRVNALQDAGLLRISHKLHLRCEICSTTMLEELAGFHPEDRIGIISVMDHTPGQRQFRDLTKLHQYVVGKYKNVDFEAHVARARAVSDRFAAPHLEAVLKAAPRLGASLASHDDTDIEHVIESAREGMSFAEFPTTLEAAQACKDHNIAIMMGAPNIVRGGSHSGNIAALDLAQQNLLDILSSDYVPSSLLLGALMLADEWNDLPRAFATVSANPASAVGLDDRGALKVGLRADMLRLSKQHRRLRETWVAGRRVA